MTREATAGHSGFVDWFADACRRSLFPRYFDRALLLSAVVLLFPLLAWIRKDKPCGKLRDTPWSLRTPDEALARIGGQPLQRNAHGWQHLFLGFALALLMLLLIGWLATTLGWFQWKELVPWAKLFRKSALPVVLVPLVEETVFRGVLLGIFLRAMKPATAVVSLSALFAFVHFLQPPDGIVIANPGSATAGFQLLGSILLHFTEPTALIIEFVTLFAVGLVLAVARLRTASLWMPMGLHAGWVMGMLFFKGATQPVKAPAFAPGFWMGKTLAEGMLPTFAVLLTGVIALLLARSMRKPLV